MQNDELVLAVDAKNVRDVITETENGPLFFDTPAESVERVGWISEDRDARVFIPRSQIESMTQYKQPCSYAIVHDGAGKILMGKRTKYSTEGRLKERVLIGFGGHISLQDAWHGSEEFEHEYIKAPFEYNVAREISEELDVSFDDDPEIVCLINDESNEVGRVHLGIVTVIRANRAPRASTEHSMLAWVDRAGLRGIREKAEPWSQLLIDELLSPECRLPRVLGA